MDFWGWFSGGDETTNLQSTPPASAEKPKPKPVIAAATPSPIVTPIILDPQARPAAIVIQPPSAAASSTPKLAEPPNKGADTTSKAAETKKAQDPPKKVAEKQEILPFVMIDNYEAKQKTLPRSPLKPDHAQEKEAISLKLEYEYKQDILWLSIAHLGHKKIKFEDLPPNAKLIHKETFLCKFTSQEEMMEVVNILKQMRHGVQIISGDTLVIEQLEAESTERLSWEDRFVVGLMSQLLDGKNTKILLAIYDEWKGRKTAVQFAKIFSEAALGGLKTTTIKF